MCIRDSPSIFAGGVIMLLGFLLFEAQFIHVVAITFTALILTELLMVALTIRTWHGLMLLAELFSVVVYISSLIVLRDYFGKSNVSVVHYMRSRNRMAVLWHLNFGSWVGFNWCYLMAGSVRQLPPYQQQY